MASELGVREAKWSLIIVVKGNIKQVFPIISRSNDQCTIWSVLKVISNICLQRANNGTNVECAIAYIFYEIWRVAIVVSIWKRNSLVKMRLGSSSLITSIKSKDIMPMSANATNDVTLFNSYGLLDSLLSRCKTNIRD